MTGKDEKPFMLRKFRPEELEGHMSVSYETPFGRVRRCIPLPGNKKRIEAMQQRLEEIRADLENRRKAE